MVSSAERYGELVRHLAAKRRMLGKAQVMGIRELASANEARLLGHRFHVVAIASPTRLWQRELTLVDRLRLRALSWGGAIAPGRGAIWRRECFLQACCRRRESGQLESEGLLDLARITFGQRIFLGHRAVRAKGGVIA